MRIFIAAMLLSVSGFAAGKSSNIFWQDDFTKLKLSNKPYEGWRCINSSAENYQGKLRLRETGKKSHGTIYHYIRYDQKAKPPYQYLQIKCGLFENPLNGAQASNVSTGGGAFGKLFTGWNTYDLATFKSLAGKKGAFALSFTIFGPRGAKPGGWFDVDLARVVRVPYQGMTMQLMPDEANKTKTTMVGDTVKICYYRQLGETVPNAIKVKLMCGKGLNPYRFSDKPLMLNDAGKGGDEKAGDSIFSTVVKINQKAYKYKGKAHTIYAAVDLNGMTSTTVLANAVDIKTQIAVPKTKFPASNTLTRKNRDLWVKLAKGKNLALGKSVKFAPAPDYALTKKGNTDAHDLTDGDLSSMSNDAIWFSSNTVGWRGSAGEGVNFKIDLGKVQKVGDVVVRLLGGKSQTNLTLPKRIEVFVSRDGKKYFKAAEMNKLMPGEKNQCDWKRYYYVSEDGVPFTYPFKLKVDADARYVGLRITGSSGWLMTDEIAVLEAKKVDNAAYKTPGVPFVTSGVSIVPRLAKFYVPVNIDAPNWFELLDMRAKKSGKLAYVIEMPEQVELNYPKDNVKQEAIGKGMIRWTFTKLKETHKRVGPVFFRMKKGAKLPKGVTAEFYPTIDGKKSNVLKRPVALLAFPIVPKLNKLHVSLAWMSIAAAQQWPDFLKQWRKLGFRTVSCFPRYWYKPEQIKAKQVFLDAARKKGYTVLMNESAFHMMERYYKKHNEIYSQMKDGKKARGICPSYRGQYYQKEMDRVANCVKDSKPDFVYWDIECWYPGAMDAPNCTRCIAGQKKSGKAMSEFLTDCGTDHFRDLKAAVKSGSKDYKMPVVGSYNNHMTHPVHSKVIDFRKVYPKYLDEAQPSLYVCGRALDVHNVIRGNYKLLNKKKKTLPWLTAGCYGEYDPYKLEQMILETLLNGGMGITYYWYGDFDNPLEFYYHAKALKEIAPYETIITDGEVLEPTGSNKMLTYSGVKKGNQMLLLVGNYQGGKPATVIKLPFSSVGQIKNLQTGKTVKAQNPLKLTVPSGKIRLLYIKGK
jgi:hypothetical protein